MDLWMLIVAKFVLPHSTVFSFNVTKSRKSYLYSPKEGSITHCELSLKMHMLSGDSRTVVPPHPGNSSLGLLQ